MTFLKNGISTQFIPVNIAHILNYRSTQNLYAIQLL